MRFLLLNQFRLNLLLSYNQQPNKDDNYDITQYSKFKVISRDFITPGKKCGLFRVNSSQIIDQEVRRGVKGGLVCEEKYIY